jgi:hypothetical protein
MISYILLFRVFIFFLNSKIYFLGFVDKELFRKSNKNNNRLRLVSGLFTVHALLKELAGICGHAFRFFVCVFG